MDKDKAINLAYLLVGVLAVLLILTVMVAIAENSAAAVGSVGWVT